MTQVARCTTHEDAAAEASCSRCGDFVCRLCTPLEPLPLCARCVLRCTVDWEERAELGLFRAFLRTLRESLGAPGRVGRTLGGAGHVAAALEYAALCALCGLLPLSLAAATPLLAWADAHRLGLESTGILGAAVALVLGALVASTLFAFAVGLGALWLWGVARAFGIPTRLDLLLRALAYGASPVAVPLLGPALSPVALLFSLLSAHAALRARAAAGPVAGALAVATLIPCLGLAIGWWLFARLV